MFKVREETRCGLARWLAGPVSVALLVSFAGCGTTSSTRPAPTTASPAAPKRPTLADEQRRFAELFRGTPVVFSLQSDGALRIEVPLHFCFDEGRARVKPPLAAVLDRVARSQLHEPTHFALTAPVDPAAKDKSLGVERAVSTRKYLLDRGIAEARFLAIAVSGSGNLSMVVTNGPAP